MEKQQRAKCEKCNSKFTYVRIKDKEIVCRSCGHVSKLNNLLEDEKIKED